MPTKKQCTLKPENLTYSDYLCCGGRYPMSDTDIHHWRQYPLTLHRLQQANKIANDAIQKIMGK